MDERVTGYGMWRGVAVATVVLMTAIGCAGAPPRSSGGPSATAVQPSVALRELSAASLTEWFACQDQLPIADTVVYTAATDPNELLGRPGQYTGKATLVDTGTGMDEQGGIDAGASLEVFDDVDTAERRLAYLEAVTTAAPMFAEYHWLHGTVLLRVAHTLTPDQAAEYEQVLEALPAGGVPSCATG